MGRTSKFSFPMPGRKARSHQSEEHLAKPEEPKLSKVERLLGTTNLPVNNQPHHAHQLQHVLRKQASSITLTVYEPTIADASEYGSDVPDVPRIPDFAFSQVENDLSPFNHVPRTMSMNPKISPRPADERKFYPRSQSSNDVPSIRQFKTQADLSTQKMTVARSYSDHHLFAPIRNDSPVKPVSTMHSLFPVAESTQPAASGVHVPYPTESLLRTESSKKRPNKLDFTKLLSRPSTSVANAAANRGLISPTYATQRFPSDVNCPPELQNPAAFNGKSQRRLQKNGPIVSLDSEIRPKTAVDPREKPVRKRQDPSRRSKHWFDGLLEAEDDVELDLGTKKFTEESPPEKLRNALVPNGLSIRMVDQSSPMHQPKSQLPFTQPELLQRTSWQGAYARSHQASVIYDVPSQRASVNTARHSAVSEQELGSQSLMEEDTANEIAALDWADMEDDDDDDELNLRDIRASIALYDVDVEDIEVVEAQAFHVRPQRHVETSEVETVEVKKSSRWSQSQFQQSPTRTTQDIPLPSSSPPAANYDRTSGGYEQSITETIRTESNPSRPESFNAPSIRTMATQRSDNRPRLMAVTEEEEALLEMMRQKRAAMASHSFAEGYKTALMSTPQSPLYESQFRANAHARNDTSSTSCSIPSIQHVENHPKMMMMDPHSRAVEPQKMAEQRRGSEPTFQPSKARHHKLHSASTLQSINAHRTVHESSHQHTSSSDPIFIRLSTISTSPMIGNGSLSTSPSEKSGLSSIPSPVTPFTIPMQSDIRVQIADSSLRSNSSTSIAEFADTTFETPKAAQVANPVENGQHAVLRNAAPGYQPYRSTSNVIIREAPKGRIVKRNVSADDTHNPVYQATTVVTHAVQNSQPPSSHQIHDHVHHRGCCGASKVRCSVADDVMAAWSSLGGWQETDQYRLY